MKELEKLIADNKVKNNKEKHKYSFIEYLEKVKNNPGITMLAHERIYKSIRKNNILKNNFFGMDSTINKIIKYFYCASMLGEESRQVLYLVGPVGSGKSSIVDSIKGSLELSEGIYSLLGCPLREDPIHLVPKELRSEFERILNIEIEGELCPVCKYRLKEEYGNNYEVFPVEKVDFSIVDRKGIGVVPPVDINNQDTSLLIGSVDISKMDLYPEDDPRVFSLNGAFNVGNRGIVEFIEVFKNDVEYLHTLITATQEKQVPSPGKGAMIYFDGAIIAHSNETEWINFKSDMTNEAILDRIVKIEVPYCLELNKEVMIYRKILNKSKFKSHIAPYTLEVAAMFAILTRINESNKVDLITKIKIYNGEKVVDINNDRCISLEELKGEFKDEGMKGISTRMIIKAIDNVLADAKDSCITPDMIIEELIIQVMDLSISDKKKNIYLGFLNNQVKSEYNRVLENDILKLYIDGYQDKAQDLFDRYLDSAIDYINTNNNTNEAFMRSIEEQIGIREHSSKGFREDITSYMVSLYGEKAKNLQYTCYEPLKKAIELKILNNMKEILRLIKKDNIRNKSQEQRYNIIVENMQEKGYCLDCSDKVLDYASNNLWKD